jgi:hypothetical protein
VLTTIVVPKRSFVVRKSRALYKEIAPMVCEKGTKKKKSVLKKYLKKKVGF